MRKWKNTVIFLITSKLKKPVFCPIDQEARSTELVIDTCTKMEQAMLHARNHAAAILLTATEENAAPYIKNFLFEQYQTLDKIIWSSIKYRILNEHSNENIIQAMEENGIGIRNNWKIVILNYFPNPMTEILRNPISLS